MAQRSTLLARLDKEHKDLEARLEVAKNRVRNLEAERKALVETITHLRASVKKSVASVSEMPRKTGSA